MAFARTWAPRAVVGSAVAVGALAAAATVAAGAAGPPLLLPLSSALAGVLALAGVPVLLLARRARGPLPGVRRAGLAVASLAGTGSLLVGVQQLLTAGPLPYPAAGDLLTLASAPFVVLMVLRVPRTGGDAVRLPRLLPVALPVGSSVALLVWRTVLVGDGTPSAGAVVTAAAVMVMASAVVLLVAVAAVGREPGTTVLVASGCLLALGYTVLAANALVPGVALPALAAALPCLAWPLVWAGLVLLPASVRPLDPAGRAAAERSSTVFTVGATCAAAISTVLATGLGAGPLDPFGLFLLTGVPVGIVLHVVVTQRQHLAQLATLLHLADHDPMTGLDNRRALATALSSAGGAGEPVGVAVVNLDGFAAINDRLGDRGGDAVLIAVAQALVATAPDGVGVFRLGGDEFALVAPLDAAGTFALAGRARATIASAAAEVPGMGVVRLSTSWGVHSQPEPADGRSSAAMAPVGLASAALQAARRAGRDRVVVWSEDLAADDRRHDLVEARLRRALAEGGLQVHLQPVVDVATGRVVGFEALSRWTDDELGPVSPVEFVAVAEATGLVVELGRSVMADALTALVTTGGLQRRLSMAVNASPVELRRQGFVTSVADALAVHGVPPDLLVVEVTEAIFVTADDPAVAALDELAAMGVSVAVDDFGTGYSSLSYLTRLPVHELKIDRSLTSHLHEGPMHAVVTALVAMADALGLEVVAEGVEETAQADALAAMGVTRGQGWLWSRALPVAEATALLASQDPPCPAPSPAVVTALAADLVEPVP